MDYPGIFNDVLAPVTPGPSSSNTSGVSRIGNTIRKIFGAQPQRVLVEMSTKGAFPDTFIGMKSDLALYAGLLGHTSDTYDLKQAKQDAAEAGMTFEVRFTDKLPGEPFELMRLTLTDATGFYETYLAASTGGGGFEITEVGDFQIRLNGKEHIVLLFCDDPLKGDADRKRFRGLFEKSAENTQILSAKAGGLICITLPDEPEDHFWSVVSEMSFHRIVYLPPVTPYGISQKRPPIFTSCSDMLTYGEEKQLSLPQIALEYEKAISGWTEEQLISHAEQLLEIVRTEVEEGLRNDLAYEGIIPPVSGKLMQGFRKDGLLGSFVSSAAAAAQAVIEFSNAGGTIVCMPTGGSAGILAGVFYVAEKEGCSRRQVIEAMLVSGLMGLFLYESNYSGAIGCQAEVGCAVAMAAAAVCHLYGGNSLQCCNAAALGLQSTLGLICDPVAGLVQIPCMIRNMTGVGTACVAASASLHGFPAVIPFDEMVGALLQVGEKVRSNGDCGTCATRTACMLAAGRQHV